MAKEEKPIENTEELTYSEWLETLSEEKKKEWLQWKDEITELSNMVSAEYSQLDNIDLVPEVSQSVIRIHEDSPYLQEESGSTWKKDAD